MTVILMTGGRTHTNGLGGKQPKQGTTPQCLEKDLELGLVEKKM